MADEARRAMTINLSDECRLLTLRTVLSYEAGVRGLSIGQALMALLLEAADLDSYPAEVRQQLADLRADPRVEAARRCLARTKAMAS